MGTHGPPPKRSSQRRRTNSPPSKKAPTTAKPRRPSADRSWHPAAKRWYQSLARSGQSSFYEPSDWSTAWAMAESLSREMKPQPLVVGDEVRMVELPIKAATLTAFLKGATALLATEGDRRRAALELQRPEAQEADGDVSWIDDARHRLREPG